MGSQSRSAVLVSSAIITAVTLVAGPAPAAGTVAPVASASSASSASSADGTDSDQVRPRGKRARVVEVTDGDSIKVRLVRSDAPRNVRLIGIDTPEVHGQRECGGPEASRSLRRMLPVGTVVRLVRDPLQDNRDLFNRLLRYVEMPGGPDLGRKQVRRGWARVFIFGGETFERERSYRRAMREAEDADRGAWGLC